MGSLLSQSAGFWIRSLTFRYLLGLGAIAILAISGQFVIQLTLSHQSIDSNEIRAAETLASQSREFGKLALQLQMSSQTALASNLASQLRASLKEMEAGHRSLVKGNPMAQPRRKISSEATKYFLPLAGRFDEIKDLLGTLSNGQGRRTVASETVRLAHALVGKELAYRGSLNTLLSFYAARSTKRVTRLKFLEWTFLLLTLIVLVLEGVFIFRPAIAQLKSSFRNQEQSSDKLARTNKLLEQFAYVASHDLREPLRTIALYLNLLERQFEGKMDDKSAQYLHFAQDGAKRLDELVSGLLEYSRLESENVKWAVVNSEALLEDVLRMLGKAVNESRATVTHGSLPIITGDSGLLVHLFQNLISNALKFRREEPPVISISAQDSADRVLFAISDNGIGFEMNHSQKIFEIFQRFHNRAEFPGAGIGLAVCKRIVESHGGKIWAESVPNVGTTIRFSLPKTIPVVRRSRGETLYPDLHNLPDRKVPHDLVAHHEG